MKAKFVINQLVHIGMPWRNKYNQSSVGVIVAINAETQCINADIPISHMGHPRMVKAEIVFTYDVIFRLPIAFDRIENHRIERIPEEALKAAE